MAFVETRKLIQYEEYEIDLPVNEHEGRGLENDWRGRYGYGGNSEGNYGSGNRYGSSRQSFRRIAIPDKFWVKREQFFSRFDEGVQVGEYDWKNLTPETIARDLACRFTGMKHVLDLFCGVGGHSIQLVLNNKELKVTAIDSCRRRIDRACDNATIYGVDKSISFMHGGVNDAAASFIGKDIDAVFLRPPGDDRMLDHGEDRGSFDISRYKQSVDIARKISENVCIVAPRNLHPMDVYNQFGPCEIEIESNYVQNVLCTKTIYFGDLIKPWEEGDPEVLVYKVARPSDINSAPIVTDKQLSDDEEHRNEEEGRDAHLNENIADQNDQSSDLIESFRQNTLAELNEERREPEKVYEGLYKLFEHLWRET